MTSGQLLHLLGKIIWTGCDLQVSVVIKLKSIPSLLYTSQLQEAWEVNSCFSIKLRSPHGVCEAHPHQAYRPFFTYKQSHHKPITMFGGGHLKLPLRGRCPSFAPLKQCAIDKGL